MPVSIVSSKGKIGTSIQVGKKPSTENSQAFLENRTWNYEEVVPREALMRNNKPTHVGRLMTILSVKHWEVPQLRRLKARIVFRGDEIRDDNNSAA